MYVQFLYKLNHLRLRNGNHHLRKLTSLLSINFITNLIFFKNFTRGSINNTCTTIHHCKKNLLWIWWERNAANTSRKFMDFNKGSCLTIICNNTTKSCWRAFVKLNLTNTVYFFFERNKRSRIPPIGETPGYSIFIQVVIILTQICFLLSYYFFFITLIMLICRYFKV